MASTPLTASNGSGTQTATQSPQTVGGSAATARSTSLQPGTATSLLTSQNGVALRPTPLSTVNLNASTQAAPSQTSPLTNPASHHLNPILIVLCVIFLAAAFILFWTTNRSAKNTTEY